MNILLVKRTLLIVKMRTKNKIAASLCTYYDVVSPI